jgi:oligopeptidase B
MNRSLTQSLFRDLVLSMVLLLLGNTSNTLAQQDPKPPVAAAIPHRIEAHGHVRIDPYYWLRDRENPNVVEYLKAENAYTDVVLAGSAPLRETLYNELIARIKQTDDRAPVFDNGYFYIVRYIEGKQYPIRIRKKGSLAAPEEVVLDENEQAQGHAYFDLGQTVVSPDNRLLAFATDTTGRRFHEIRIKNLETGEFLPDQITDVTENLAWANDSQTLFYVKQDPETLRTRWVKRHKIGASPESDPVVFEETDETFYCHVGRTRSNRYVWIQSQQTLSSEYRYIDADAPETGPEILEPRARNHEYHAEHIGDQFYIRTNQDAPNFRLMAAPVATPGKEHWRELVPHRKDVFLADVAAFERFLVLSEREQGLTRLRFRRRDGSPLHEIAFQDPTYDIALGQNPEPDPPTIRYRYESLTTPESDFDYDPASGVSTLVKRKEVRGGFDPANYQSERLWAIALDGAKVPISLVYRKDKRVPGGNPLLLYAYGSYGASTDATFDADRLSLLDRGFGFAIAHVRGGQELGRAWYENGKLLKKINTFTDFIACAEHLVAAGYTKKDRLFAQGGSAGGLLMGAIATMRPDLFRGVIADVPFVDVVTTMQDATIPLTTNEYDEWGNPNDKAYYDYMLSYSPYDKVASRPYPNLLVTTSLADSQVQYWEPAKWVAKLRAQKTGPERLLLRTYLDGSHGGVSGRYSQYRETAFSYSFLLDLVPAS